jgi:hypothetical protein
MKPRLYLDIDGVLDSDTSIKEAKIRHPDYFELLQEDYKGHKHILHKLWDFDVVLRLRRLLDEVDPEIYIHSTWRHHFTLDEIISYFKYWSIPTHGVKDFVPQYKFSAERYHILAWHIEGQRCTEDDAEPCANYVILDDYDMTDVFKDKGYFDRQVVVDASTGLTGDNVDRAIELFGV